MQFLPLTLRLQVYNSALGVNSLPYHCTTKICQETYPRTYSQNEGAMRAANPIQNDVRVKAFSISRLVSAKLGCISTVTVKPHSNPGCGSLRSYATCCPRPPKGCGCPAPGGGRKIVPPTTCRPGPIPPNPCVPVFHHGKDTWKRPKYIFYFLCLPVIFIQAFQALSHEVKPKDECRDYEYMRIRSKRFPWGDGVKSLFHNDHVNHLPGECVPPPLDCD